MLMGLQPGTIMQAHKHENPDKRELFTWYQGRVAVLIWDRDGLGFSSYFLSAREIRTVEIEKTIYHSLVCLEKDSALLETKDGPYNGVEEDKSFASWMPGEDSPCATKYISWLENELANIKSGMRVGDIILPSGVH